MKHFELTWNALPAASRKRLLSLAGYPKFYASRVFEYLPSWVRVDVEYTYRRYGQGRRAA